MAVCTGGIFVLMGGVVVDIDASEYEISVSFVDMVSARLFGTRANLIVKI